MKMKKAWSDFKSSIVDAWNFLSGVKIEKYSFFLCLIFLLSILDAVFTMIWIKTGMAVEANPLLGSLLEHGDLPFILTKVFLTGCGCAFLGWSKSKSRFAKASILTLLALYCCLTIYHLLGALHSVHHDLLPEIINDFLVLMS